MGAQATASGSHRGGGVKTPPRKAVDARLAGSLLCSLCYTCCTGTFCYRTGAISPGRQRSELLPEASVRMRTASGR